MRKLILALVLLAGGKPLSRRGSMNGTSLATLPAGGRYETNLLYLGRYGVCVDFARGLVGTEAPATGSNRFHYCGG
jgi:hypothetical protein